MSHRNGVALTDEEADPPIARPTEPAPPTHFRVSNLWRGAPRLVALVILLNAAIMVLSIFAWPPNRSPDELVHVDLVAAVARGTAIPWPGPAQLRQAYGDKASVVVAAGCRCESLPAKDAPAAWPTWNDVGGDKATVHINWMVQHPPLYYVFMASALKVFPNWRNHPYNVVLGYLKLVNLIFILPLPLLAWAAARRLTGNAVVGATAAVGAVLVPHVQHVGSSINNDNLLIFEVSLLTVLLSYVIRGDTSRRTAIFVGLVLAAALLTKGTALLAVPWVLLAYLIAWRRTGTHSWIGLRRAVVPAGIAMGAGALGGWWWVRNKIAYGVVQVNGSVVDQHAVEPRRSATTFTDTGLEFAVKFLKNMVMTFWLDTTQRPVATGIARASAGLSAVTGIVVLVGIGRALLARAARPAAGGLELRGSDVLFLLTLPVLVLGVLLSGSWPAWRTALASAGQQGRYLYPAIVGLLILFSVGLRVLAGRWSVLLATIAIGITQLMMMVALVSSYWLPRGRAVSLGLLGDAWNAMVAWSALNGAGLGVLVALVVVLFAATAREAAHFGVTHNAAQPPPTGGRIGPDDAAVAERESPAVVS